jgi:hypothetical protein
MVMNEAIDWLQLYKGWRQYQSDYFAAQKALDDTMSSYLEVKGPPPSRQVMNKVDDLRLQMLEARAAVDAFIAAHATDHRQMHNLPRHQ